MWTACTVLPSRSEASPLKTSARDTGGFGAGLVPIVAVEVVVLASAAAAAASAAAAAVASVLLSTRLTQH